MSRQQAALAEAREIMAAHGLDTLVCLFDGVHSYLEANPVYDLTGFKPVDSSAALVEDGTVDLLLTPSWDVNRATERAGSHVRVAGCEDLAAELASRTLGKGRVGVVGLDAVPARLAQAVSGAARELVDVSDAVLQRQRPKDEEEFAKACRAAEVAEQAFEAFVERLRPGLHEYELGALLDYEVRMRGGDDDFLLMSSSAAGVPVRASSARRLEAGDLFNAEISPAFGYQFVQITRSVVLGRASATQREDYELLVTSLRDGMAAAKPGATVADVVAAMDRPSVEAGFPQYTRPPYIRVRGHGQGIASLSPGDIVFDNHTVLQKGMVFTMHPNQPTPRSGYMMCGDPVVITDSGARPLTSKPIRLFETGG